MQPTMTTDDDGTKRWMVNELYHRTDGPACEHADGTKEWAINDQLHRDDGPAVEWADGGKEWFLNGERLSFDEWLDQVHMTDEEKIMYKLEYG